MNFDAIFLLLALAAYLVGSVSTAIIACKLMGLEDPRSSGSNNPGATNVLRIGGKKAAIITLLGDMLKGLVPVLWLIYSDIMTQPLHWSPLVLFWAIYFRYFLISKAVKA